MKAFFITAGLVAAAAAQNASSTCVSGDAVHMIIARASLEPPGTGVIGNVSSRVAEQLPGSDVVAVEYPATLDNYQSSEAQGVAAMMKLVTSYASQCPDSRMILMGYSQGAQVTADVLCGTMEASFNTTEALSTSIQDKGKSSFSIRTQDRSDRHELLTSPCSCCCRADGRPVESSQSDLFGRDIHKEWGE